MQTTDFTFDLGLVLSGGGAKGFAHLGAIQALNENGLYPEVITGTSAGAFAGVLYADGHTPREIASFFKQKKFQEFAELGIPHAGFFKSTRFCSFLETHLNARRFEDLKIPLRVVATDIENGTFKVFTEGDVIPTVVASCSVPLVFAPIEIEGRYYVDGGLLKNFPVSTIRKDCRKVFGVNVSPIRPLGYKHSLKYVAERTFHYMSSSNTVQDRKLCDYLVESADLSSYSMFDLDNVDEIFNAGYTLAMQYIDKERDRFEKDFNLYQDKEV